MENKLKIEGMHCEGCKKRVENALKGVKGVKKIKVDLENKEVSLSGAYDLDEVLSLLGDIGFEAHTL